MNFLVLSFLIFCGISFGYAYGYGEISTSEFKIVNTLGDEINSPVVEQQLNLQTSLRNISDQDIDWIYIVQIIDKDDAIVDLSFSSGSLVANQTLTASLSWIPHSYGTYKIETFVWNNLRDIDPLAMKSTFTTTVT